MVSPASSFWKDSLNCSHHQPSLSVQKIFRNSFMCHHNLPIKVIFQQLITKLYQRGNPSHMKVGFHMHALFWLVWSEEISHILTAEKITGMHCPLFVMIQVSGPEMCLSSLVHILHLTGDIFKRTASFTSQTGQNSMREAGVWSYAPRKCKNKVIHTEYLPLWSRFHAQTFKVIGSCM